MLFSHSDLRSSVRPLSLRAVLPFGILGSWLSVCDDDGGDGDGDDDGGDGGGGDGGGSGDGGDGDGVMALIFYM